MYFVIVNGHFDRPYPTPDAALDAIERDYPCRREIPIDRNVRAPMPLWGFMATSPSGYWFPVAVWDYLTMMASPVYDTAHN